MESLSRPFHRRKLSNANSFSGKNAYDGVFSGHRPKFDGVPAVNVDEYREIFSSGQAASSIPVLDLSTLQESSDGSNLELGSTKPDYGKIFGGFRDEDIAVSYEELVARDKARFSMSTSQSSQDLGDDMSNQSFDALKQFNMSYNKISQRGKDGIDGTTHVTQLHVVPGFTCFIDESASQPKKETKKQKSSIANKVHSPDKQTSQTGVESKNKYLQDESLSDDKKTDLKSRDSKLSSSPSTSEIKNEEASQSKETEKQKSSVTNDVFLDKQSSETTVESKSKYHQDELLPEDKKINLKAHDSKVSSSLATSAIKNEAAFQSKKETEKQNSSVTNDVFHDKQTSQSGVESKSKNHQDELLSDDKKTDLKSDTSKVSSLNATSAIKNEEASESKKETEKQKSCVTEDDFLEKQTSKTAVESLHDDGIFKKFKADINLHSSKSSSSPHVTSTTNADNQKDYKNGSTATSSEKWKSDTNGPFSSTCFDDELDVNSVAFASTAALKKAIEKAQESIRIAMESVGRKKEGLKSYSNKSFKDSLKVKARVVNVSTIEKQKEKDDRIKEIFKARVANVSTSQVFSEFKDGEKLFGAKKVIIINEINEKIIESSENLEIPINSSHELKDNTIVSDFQEVGETKRSFEEVENDTNESLHKDNKKPNGFFVLESRENEIRDTKDTIEDENPIELKEDKDEVGQSEETSNLTLYQRVEDEKKLSHDLDQNGYEESFDESLGLLENTKQEILEQEQDDDVASEESDHEKEREVKEESDNESFKEEEDINENFYDVCEVEIIDFSSSDYDDAEDIEIINRIVIDTEEVDKSDNNVELSQEVDDVSDRSAQVIGEDTYIDNDVESSQEVDDVSKNSHQVTEEDKETINNTEEKVIFENISVDEIASKDNDELSHCGFADVDIGQKGPEEQSESCSDSIHCMEIEVKEYKESDETLEEEEEILKKEENKIQESKEERPETMFEMETGTSQEHNKESNEDIQKDETIKVVEKEKEEQKRIKEVTNEERERERNRVAVERAIREVRERAFNEARERAERAAVERANAMKASDVTSKIRAERAAVERATSEARQRALEKAMSQKKISEPKIQVNNVVQTTTSELHISNGTSTESALRSKAKLEKHNRIMERAAKALAEKEKRDLLVQKEQAERNRLAENLDADIKRWSIGKEGNLRALLSTLQYILGPESGWQSVSLTEIITTSAVKKAYRKATLCVHPDKLQQRGASIQQKYICEKVFDLLKAAWNRFNSEER